MIRTRHIIASVALLLLLPCGASAQKKSKKKAVVEAPKVEEVVPTQEEINFQDLLPATAKVIFVDSISVAAKDCASTISLTPSVGAIAIEGGNYIFTNELGNRRIISQPDKKGIHHLYNVTKLGNGWSEPEKIDIPGDFTDIICPYLMPDGVTLYFSALGGDDNVGRHDIFFTVFDAEDGKYITPQSLGLPYNSDADDYYYITDEYSNLGFLATNRSQDSLRVCIYPFIPTETRETYGIDDEEVMTSYAKIASIKQTQTDKKAVAEAKVRLASLKKDDGTEITTFNFPMSANVIYHKVSDFKSADNKELVPQYIKRNATYAQQKERLNALRKNYRNGQTYTAKEIQELEEHLESEELALRRLATTIRKNEGRQLIIDN